MTLSAYLKRTARKNGTYKGSSRIVIVTTRNPNVGAKFCRCYLATDKYAPHLRYSRVTFCFDAAISPLPHRGTR